MSFADDLTPEQETKSKNNAEAHGDVGKLEIYDYPVALEGDYSPLLEFFCFSPTEWQVIEPVRVGKWQQSKRLESGERDLVWLYSYRAQFKRISPEQILSDIDLDASAAAVRVRTPKKSLGVGLGPEVAYVHLQGDEQTGKAEGGGLEGLLSRETEVVERSVETIKALRKGGANITSIVDLAAGDRIENIFGHYPSQSRTTDTLRKQIGFAVDMDVARTEALAQFGMPMTKAYTPSNHGELRQVIGQSPYTSASDNLDLTIAEYVRRVIERTKIADQITWEIPHDEWITVLEIAGVTCGLTHGHKVSGKVTEWVRKQRDDIYFHDGKRLVLMFMGHLHHAHIEDCAGTTLIQTPTIDGGSPYFQALSGQRSTHGALGMIVGKDLRAGFDKVTWL